MHGPTNIKDLPDIASATQTASQLVLLEEWNGPAILFWDININTYDNSEFKSLFLLSNI